MADFFSQSAQDVTQRQSNTQTPSFGNLSAFEGFFPQFYQPSGAESQIIGQIQGLPWASRFTPGMQQGFDSVQNLVSGTPAGQSSATMQQAIDTIRGLLPQQNNVRYGGALQTIEQLLRSAMSGPNQYETGGLDTLRGRTDPTALTAAAQRYMEEIAGPQARAGAQAGGLGGAKGGAFQESLSRRGAEMALPIAQLIQQALGEYGGAQMGMGGLLESRRSGLAGLLEQMRMGQVAEQSGLANQLMGLQGNFDTHRAGLGRTLFDMGMGDSRLSDMGVMTGALGAAGLPRLGSLQDFLRQQQLAMLQRGMTTSGNTNASSVSPFTVGSLLQPLTTVAAASLLNPQGASSVAGGIGSGVSSGWDWLKGLYGTGGAVGYGDAASNVGSWT